MPVVGITEWSDWALSRDFAERCKYRWLTKVFSEALRAFSIVGWKETYQPYCRVLMYCQESRTQRRAPPMFALKILSLFFSKEHQYLDCSHIQKLHGFLHSREHEVPSNEPLLLARCFFDCTVSVLASKTSDGFHFNFRFPYSVINNQNLNGRNKTRKKDLNSRHSAASSQTPSERKFPNTHCCRLG